MKSAWLMWRKRERSLEERVRILETQIYVLSDQLAQLNAVTMKKQFQRVKP
jgi:hypothetical protein